MKTIYAIANHEEAVGFIYEHDKFGKVIILERKAISLEDVLSLHSLTSQEDSKQDKIDLLKIVLDHLGMDEEQL